MIDKNYDIFTLICDVCGDSCNVGFDEFQEAVTWKKQNGWKSQSRNDNWQDVCPECQEYARSAQSNYGSVR